MAKGWLVRATGVLLLIGAAGIGVDAWLSWNQADGSWGLILAYLGTTFGLVLLVPVMVRLRGWMAGTAVAVGAASTFVFWYGYPEFAMYGGLGSLFLGAVMLSLPDWGRVAAFPWIVSGTLGLPDLVREGVSWGPVASFSVLGVAIGLTGAYVVTRPAGAGPRHGTDDPPAELPTGRNTST
ncbi:hypothetical protein [Isoptericola sediminis]|uniref:Uncharacterized protein n=1 Tax=Isoptericola sediminis TaxID=2733572 RepID=A0A849JWY4_9MICO|nr:hypothetical protein [Isoptericola sediminis]NNU27104.1 hypothetical protein [Isoptericola sediminis]